ncbi:2-haloacid dehalogenase [Jatrophihabitans endophyticus]|uniref:2-haloacid dehalogenase n=1 Tax=Jatrophihabitans endophyticus TaxID=1206085 RepID=A0A1M5DDF2_9ACTN|nr:haloacid dehalogenase type II [Jatrophihabitans endophyticus]SHF65118.1 2-haloacid dehalogenase [Jatrophihabitans endophyticus]
MAVIVFDVNETLSDLAPLGERFVDVGAPGGLLATWFASTLRDGDALGLAGTPRPFADVARGVLATLWSQLPELRRDPDEATEHVLAGFTSLAVHPDVVPGVGELAVSGHRLVTLSNGARSVAAGLLERAGVAGSFEALLSVEDDDAPGPWKPDPRAYHYAAQVCGVEPGELVLVAVHPWDLHGARRAGLRSAYVNRTGAPWPAVFDRPDVEVGALTELAAAL